MKGLLAAGALLAICLTAVNGGSAVDSTEQTVKPTTEKDLVLRVEADATSIAVEKPPKFSVTLTNRGRTPVTLVQPGDASNHGWRTPIVGWSCQRVTAGEKVVHPATAPICEEDRCGHVNAIRPGEIFVLGAGESKPLNDWIGSPHFAEPGTYSAAFYYCNEPERKWRGDRHNPELLDKVRSSFKCSVMSEPLTFTVMAGGGR